LRSTENQPDLSRIFFWISLAILVLGLGLRVGGALGDLWLDEIRTLGIVSERGTVGEIIWGPGRTNNHILNSLDVLLVGTDSSPLILRGFSVVTGVLSVAFAGLIGLRQGRMPALVSMLLISVSFIMVNFGSEARGYGAMVFFFLITVFLVDGALRGEPSRRWKIVLAAVALAGFMSHLLFVFALFGLAWWVFFESAYPGWRIRSAVARTFSLLHWTAIVTGVFATSLIITWEGLTGWRFWAGPQRLYTVFARLFQYSLGLPEVLPSESIPIIVAILTLVLWWLVRDSVSPVERRRTGLYSFHLVGVPILLFAGGLYSFVFTRFLILIAVTYLLLLGQLLGNLAARNDWRRGVSVLLLALFLLGSGSHLVRFFRWGRGSYAETVARIAAVADTEAFTVGATNAAKINREVFDYYVERSPLRWNVDWRDPSESPEWILEQGFAHDEIPCPEMLLTSLSSEPVPWSNTSGPEACPKIHRTENVPPGFLKAYRLFAYTRYWGPSGWGWKVYRALGHGDRVTPDPQTPPQGSWSGIVDSAAQS
jgi:hypothetical protein